jgi:hypothetical protein
VGTGSGDTASYAAFRVRAAFNAAALRARLPRFCELLLVCREIACRLALLFDSRFSALNTARERVREVLRRGCSPASVSRSAFFRTEAGPFGVPNFTPARRALERPMAIACSGERAPCLPSRTWCISSRTNSPALVDGALPSRASSRARSTVARSGTTQTSRN